MKTQKIAFKDFWPKWTFQKFHVFNEIIPEICDIEIVQDNPDYLFFSVFGEEYKSHYCPKIFYSAENRRREERRFALADWSFSHHYRDDDSHYRLPNWLVLYGLEILGELTEKSVDTDKTKFCNFLYSNPHCSTRNEFFRKLSEYKKVDAGGSLFNNVDRVPYGKEIEWMSDYKFSIAFENREREGYTTEKIVQAFLADTVPIYWGNPRVDEDFNPDAFINAYDFDNFDELSSYVKMVDHSDILYKSYQQAKPMKEIPAQWTKQALKKRMEEIFV